MPVTLRESLIRNTSEPSGSLPNAKNSSLDELGFDIRVSNTTRDIEKIWREFESQVSLSCYQRFDFVDAWFLNLGHQKGYRPFIISGFDRSNKIAFLWPLALKSSKMGNILVWPGEKHSNYNMGLNRPDMIPMLTGAFIRKIFKTACKVAPFDAVHLMNQPETWENRSNPFLSLKRNLSPSFAYSADFSAGFDTYFQDTKSKRARKRLRWQERRLNEMGKMSFERADTSEKVERFLNIHFAQREARFEQLGKLDNLSEPGTKEFLKDLANRAPLSANPPLELYALVIDDNIYSVYGGAVGGQRFSAFFNSIDTGEASRFSAGGTLLHYLIRYCSERNLTSLDLGIGEADYKNKWCTNTDILFDAFLGFGLRGKLSCIVQSNGRRLKRYIKGHPRMLSIIHRVLVLLHPSKSG